MMFTRGMFVTTKDGRTGVVDSRRSEHVVLVRYGADGPYDTWSEDSMRKATPAELVKSLGFSLAKAKRFGAEQRP